MDTVVIYSWKLGELINISTYGFHIKIMNAAANKSKCSHVVWEKQCYTSSIIIHYHLSYTKHHLSFIIVVGATVEKQTKSDNDRLQETK